MANDHTPAAGGALDRDVERASALLGSATRVAVLTGAGISTDSGIPDFRGPNGVWTKNPKAELMATLHHYLNDPEVRRLSWQSRLSMKAWDLKPNDGHRALVRLEERGVLHTLVTQNVDALHQKAGSDPARIVEVHGTLHRALCWSCRREFPMAPFVERVEAGEEDPDCPECGGIVKSATISFGQNLVPEDIDRAFAAAEACDLLLCVGTTLAVGPVNNMVPLAFRAGAPIVILNGGPTEMDSYATVKLDGSISALLPRIVG